MPASGIDCPFCAIADDPTMSQAIFDDEETVSFLDSRPIFPGHVLLIPRVHLSSLEAAGPILLCRMALNAQLLARAVEEALGAQGAFVAVNNKVSQSIPHLHIHIVPRNKGDGLRGFFWPRRRYESEEHLLTVRDALRETIGKIRGPRADVSTQLAG